MWAWLLGLALLGAALMPLPGCARPAPAAPAPSSVPERAAAPERCRLCGACLERLERRHEQLERPAAPAASSATAPEEPVESSSWPTWGELLAGALAVVTGGLSFICDRPRQHFALALRALGAGLGLLHTDSVVRNFPARRRAPAPGV